MLCEAANAAKPKPRDENALAPRKMRIRLLEKHVPHQSSNDEVDLEKHEQGNRMMFVPQEALDEFSKAKKKEARDQNRVVRRARQERKERAPLPGPQAVPQARPRSNNVQNKKQKASATTRKGLLGTMEELGNTSKAGAKEEVPKLNPRRSQREVAFEVAAKRG